MKQAVLIALGDELLSGVRREGNCGWLAGRLAFAGWKVLRMEIIPDGLGVLEETLGLWIGKADLVVISGGLGPTHDDCTRQALARFLDSPLFVDESAYDKVLSRYPDEMKLNLEACRVSQGSVPAGAMSVHNPLGSALGISFVREGTRVYAFPGVPGEYRAMAEQELWEEMLARDRRMLSVVVAGWPESLLKDRIAPVIEQNDLHISILPSPGVIELVLRGEPSRIKEAEILIRELLPGDCLPEGILTIGEAVLREAGEKGISISCAESCTGGMVGAALTDTPGSSDVFLGSAVCYSNEAKERILSVPAHILEQYGAVSSECAVAMAQGAMRQFGSGMAVSVTGIAGPDGGSVEKPVGTVWFAVAHRNGVSSKQYHFPGDRMHIRNRATNTALQLLRRALLEAK